MKLKFATVTIPLIAVALLGCPASDDAGGSADGNETSGTADGSGDETMDSISSTSISSTDTGTSTTATTATMTASTTMPPEPQPNGSMCTENSECISEMCFFVSILGGICGECLTDDDCPDGGCSLPNPLSDPPVGAECNTGMAGEGCMTDAVCEGDLVCAEIINVPGILEANTCSECNVNADCADGQFCTPEYDILEISGVKTCNDPGGVPNGQGCDPDEDEACESGICAAVNIMDIITVGVCGDCEVDADCETAGDVCLPADADLMTGDIIPPTCGPPA